MATKKVAESTLYHLSPQGFWKKFSVYIPILLSQTYSEKSNDKGTRSLSTLKSRVVCLFLALIVAPSLLQDQKNTAHPQLKVLVVSSSFNVLLMGFLASDPAQNPYWKRDVRRAYPQLSVVTQSDLSSFLIEHAGTQTYVCLSDNLLLFSHNIVLQHFSTL
jgi:hypothetical protein